MEGAPPTFCPECGAPAPFRGAAVSLVCEYCNSTVVRTGVDISLIGKVSAVIDTGSPILLNSEGNFGGLNFRLEGRLQVRYARGTWNEWFVTFADGTVGWLSDAQGQFAMMRPVGAAPPGAVPPFEELTPGRWLTLQGKQLGVVDCRGASYQGAEGILPFAAQPGTVFYAVDLRSPQGDFATLDYGNSPHEPSPTLYVGRAIQLDEIKLRPLRRFEGWN